MNINLSIIIVACNEGRLLEDCIKSSLFADEIIVFDMLSKDNTPEICSKYGIKYKIIDKHPFVELVRNFTIQSAENEWVLILDPDERVGSGLKSNIEILINQTSVFGYYIPRKNLIFGEWARTMDWWPDSQLRLFRKDFVKYKGIIHETPIIDGATEILPFTDGLAIEHINYESVTQFVDKMNRYTTAIALDYEEQKITFNFISLIYRPTREFVKRFFYHGGFKQGLYGFILSLLMAVYHLLIWIKLWERRNKKI